MYYIVLRYIFATFSSCWQYIHSHIYSMSSYHITFLTLLTTLLFCGGREAMSQTHLVLIDKETSEPVNNATVVTNKGESARSTKMGHVTLNDPFESLTISHISFLKRKMDKKEVTDTIWLLPNAIHLHEVVVFGEDRPLIKSLVKDAVKDAPMYAPPKAAANFDFFKMFEKKPLNKKARKRNKEILENWDKEYNKEEDATLPMKP